MTFDERVAKVTAKGFTDRQARFLVTVMLHSGVCMIRQYCAFATMVYGQTARDFFTALVARGQATLNECAHKRARIYHIHHRALYEAIGEPHSRLRKPAAMARAIERLMLLDAVLGSRDLAWLATERDKLAHFTRLLGTQLHREELPHLNFGTKDTSTLRFFADRMPIGVESEGGTHVFLYLVTRSTPGDFRGFLHRHAELLRALPRWTIRLVFPPHLTKATGAFVTAGRQELTSPLRPSIVSELRWFFEQQRARSAGLSAADDAEDPRYAQARRAFSAPRFGALYRAWLRAGPSALNATMSPVLADAVEQGTGQVEYQVLPRAYLHLAPLVSTA